MLVIDVTDREGFGCGQQSYRAPGNITNGIGIPKDSVYIDHATGNIIPPFGPADKLGLCMAIDFSGGTPSVEMLRDEHGRIIAEATVGDNLVDNDFKYSNGFRSKTGDDFADVKSKLNNALGGLANGEGFQPSYQVPPIKSPPVQAIPYNPNEPRFVGPNSGNNGGSEPRFIGK